MITDHRSARPSVLVLLVDHDNRSQVGSAHLARQEQGPHTTWTSRREDQQPTTSVISWAQILSTTTELLPIVPKEVKATNQETKVWSAT